MEITMTAMQSKKPVNLSIDLSLLNEAKSYKINISKAAERGIIDALSKIRAEIWQKDNLEALQSSNSYLEKNGLPLAKYRQF